MFDSGIRQRWPLDITMHCFCYWGGLELPLLVQYRGRYAFGYNLEEVECFEYMGSKVTKDG